MSFDATLPQEALEQALRAAGRAVGGRGTHAVLSDVLLAADEGLTATGYNLALGVRATAPAAVAEAGRVCVPHKLLAGLIAHAPAGEPVRLLHDADEGVLHVEAGQGRYRVALAHDAADFPELPQAADGELALPWGALSRALGAVAHAASQAEAKPELAGVRFELPGDGELRLEAIDGHGHRAVFWRLPGVAPEGADPSGFTVPSEAVRELLRLGVDDDDLVGLAVDRGVLVVDAGGVHLVTNLLDGKWPPMYSKLPAKSKVRLLVDRAELLAAVERIQVIADLAECVVVLEHSAGEITVSAENDMGAGTDHVALEDGSTESEGRLLFRSRLLLDALRHVEDSLVTINYVRPDAFVIFEPSGSTLHRYLVMTMAPKP